MKASLIGSNPYSAHSDNNVVPLARHAKIPTRQSQISPAPSNIDLKPKISQPLHLAGPEIHAAQSQKPTPPFDVALNLVHDVSQDPTVRTAALDALTDLSDTKAKLGQVYEICLALIRDKDAPGALRAEAIQSIDYATRFRSEEHQEDIFEILFPIIIDNNADSIARMTAFRAAAFILDSQEQAERLFSVAIATHKDTSQTDKLRAAAIKSAYFVRGKYGIGEDGRLSDAANSLINNTQAPEALRAAALYVSVHIATSSRNEIERNTAYKQTIQLIEDNQTPLTLRKSAFRMISELAYYFEDKVAELFSLLKEKAVQSRGSDYHGTVLEILGDISRFVTPDSLANEAFGIIQTALADIEISDEQSSHAIFGLRPFARWGTEGQKKQLLRFFERTAFDASNTTILRVAALELWTEMADEDDTIRDAAKNKAWKTLMNQSEAAEIRAAAWKAFAELSPNYVFA